MTNWTRYFTLLKLLLASSIGVFLFFVQIDFNGKSTIFLDHASDFIIFKGLFFHYMAPVTC